MDQYVELAVIEGIGPGMIAPLLDPTADPAALLRGEVELPPAARRRLRHPQRAASAQQWRRAAEVIGVHLLTPADPGYPPCLRNVPLRPLVLFADGNLDLLQSDRPSVALVGSRTPTPYGMAAAEAFATALAKAGVVLWSGLAVGIDAIGHRAALAHDAPTVAVIAGGHSHIYPSEHRELAREIASSGGLVLSEAPPHLRARRGHFPRRNRILATATDAVLVVEAGRASGTLHTAHHAADAGTAVFAVPGPYGSPRSEGCHALIADGAQIAVDPADLLRRLGVEGALRGTPAAQLTCGADGAAILRALDSGPRPADLVQREANLATAEFLRALLALEQGGWLSKLPGDMLARR